MSHYCTPCDRWFVSQQAIQSHYLYSYSHLGEPCDESSSDYESDEFDESECIRCDRVFGSEESLCQHIRDSTAHWLCDRTRQAWVTPRCSFDGCTLLDLFKHWDYRGCYAYCRDCSQAWLSRSQLAQHIKDHVVSFRLTFPIYFRS